MKYKKYSESEIQVILDQVRTYPDNLSYGFKKAAKILNRHFKSIEMKYYNDLRKRSDLNIVTCGSSKGFTNNTKNTHSKGNSLETRTLNKALWVITEFLELPKEERQMIAKIVVKTSTK